MGRDPLQGEMLTGAQTRMWISQSAEPEDPSWNMSFGWRLDGELDEVALRRAVEELLVWHPVLGHTFREIDGVPRAFPAENDGARLAWDLVDLSDGPPDEDEERTRRHLIEVARQPIDLGHGPLLRVTLVRERPTCHVLHLVVHHIVFDGRSQEIVARDIARLYVAASTGAPLPAPAVTADAAVGQEEADAEERALSLKYWTDKLCGIELAELPTDHLDPACKGTIGSHTVVLGGATLAALREVANSHRSTLFMTALAGLQVVLARFAGAADVIVGTPVSTRTTVALDETVGVFFNPVLVHASVDPAARVEELLEQVRDSTLEAFQHSDAPFNEVVAALRPVRSDDASPPMLQTWFEIQQDEEDGRLDLPGLVVSRLDDAQAALRSHLDVTVAVGPAGLAVRLNYPADRFHADFIARVATTFAAVLETLAEGSTGTIGRLGRGDGYDPELRDLYVGPERLDAGADFLTDVFRWSLEEPDRVAVTHAGTRLTYGALLDRSRWVADRVRALGLGADDVVAVHMDRQPDLLVTMLGVMLAGGAYLPLDPGLPVDRLRTIVEDAGPRLIVTDRPDGEVAAWVPEVVAVDDVGTAIGPLQDYPGARTEGRRLAYVMYTSGSTGRPKGVLIERAGLTNFVRWCARGYDSGRPEGAPVFSSASFDAVLPNLFGPLVLGQRVHLLPADLDIGDLGIQLRDAGPFNYIKLTPQHLDVLAAQLTAEEASALCGRLVVGADTFPRSTLERWRTLDPDTPILNEYGPTEITVANSTYVVDGVPAHDVLPIGRPIPGTSIWILDQELRPVPRGGVGEICVGGIGVARGYLGRPDVTAAVFLPDPLSSESGARIYRTGDFGRVGPDGQVEFRGRRDQQIKVRGFRVEPAEVESALISHREVGAAHVTGFRTPEGGMELVAYVVTERPVDDRVLRRRLRDALPAYLVPSHFVRVNEIPLTPHGKVDSRRLPTPRVTEGAARPPAQVADCPLGQIWADVLGVDHVGPHDHFFELGGHSLLALKLIARVEQASGRKLRLKDVFEAPTVSAMEERLNAAPKLAASRRTQATLDAGVRPITAEQARILYAQEASGSTTQFNLVGGWTLSGPVDAEALAEAVRRLLERHIALRTRIELRGGAFVQVLDDAHQVDVRHLDLSDWDATAARARVRQVAVSLDRVAFALGERLFRVRLVTLGSEEHVVLLGAHHAVVDGWSMGLLMRDLGELYAAVQEGRDDRLPTLRIGYDDLAPLAAGESMTGIDAATPPLLPADRPRLGDSTSRDAAAGDVVEALVAGATWAGVRDVARVEGTTPFVVLLACVQTVVANFAASSSYSFGFSDAGRDDPDVHDAVGPFFRQAVAVADLRGEPTLREVVRRAGVGVLEARAGLDAASPRGRAELSQSLWVEMEPDESQPTFPSDVRVTELVLPVEAVKNDLVFSMRERNAGVEVRLAYRSALFDASTAARLLDDLMRVVGAVHATPDSTVSIEPHRTPTPGAAVALPPASTPPPPAARSGAVDLFLATAGEILGVADIGPEDNFFELGGDSIRALGFVGKLREQGLGVTVRDLIGRATFAELAAVVSKDAPPEHETPDGSLVHLRVASGGRRLFCIHPSGGGVQWYFNLADSLPDGCGLSAFQAMDGRWRDRSVTVEEMASAYAEELCLEVDTGPYTILGWSASGVWAIEMGRQLRARGVEVAPLILVEPALPDLTGRAEIRRAWSDFSDAADLVDEIAREDLKPAEAVALRKQLVDLVARSGVLSDRVPEISTSAELRMAAALEIALLNYTPVPYDGPAILVVGDEVTVADADHPSRVAGDSPDAYLDRWRSLFPAGAVELHHVGGGHISIIQDREHAAEVAGIVTDAWENERAMSGGRKVTADAAAYAPTLEES